MESSSGDRSRKDWPEKSEVSSSSEDVKPCKPDSGGGGEGSARPSSPRSTQGGGVSSTDLPCPPADSLHSSARGFVLNPPRLSNPFLRHADEEREGSSREGRSTVAPADLGSASSTPNDCSAEAGGSLISSSIAASPNVSFVPLGGEPHSIAAQHRRAPSSSSPHPLASSFVFGQNLRDRVEGAKCNENQTQVSSSTDSRGPHSSEGEEPRSNGTAASEMLFSSAVRHDSADSRPSESTKSLSEAAREFEEARSVKRKFEPVRLITGEEHEQNVLQMNCKLFAFDKDSSGWQERGRGLLRLNDSHSGASRLIIRAHGSLRLLINTKVWCEMVVQRASPKSLRITAMDSGGTVKVFLISASHTEMDELQRYLETRVRKSEGAAPQEQSKRMRSQQEPSES